MGLFDGIDSLFQKAVQFFKGESETKTIYEQMLEWEENNKELFKKEDLKELLNAMGINPDKPVIGKILLNLEGFNEFAINHGWGEVKNIEITEGVRQEWEFNPEEKKFMETLADKNLLSFLKNGYEDKKIDAIRVETTNGEFIIEMDGSVWVNGQLDEEKSAELKEFLAGETAKVDLEKIESPYKKAYVNVELKEIMERWVRVSLNEFPDYIRKRIERKIREENEKIENWNEFKDPLDREYYLDKYLDRVLGDKSEENKIAEYKKIKEQGIFIKTTSKALDEDNLRLGKLIFIENKLDRFFYEIPDTLKLNPNEEGFDKELRGIFKGLDINRDRFLGPYTDGSFIAEYLSGKGVDLVFSNGLKIWELYEAKKWFNRIQSYYYKGKRYEITNIGLTIGQKKYLSYSCSPIIYERLFGREEADKWDAEKEFDKKNFGTSIATEYLMLKGYDPFLSKFVLDIKMAGYEVPEELKTFEREITAELRKNPVLEKWERQNVSKEIQKKKLKSKE
ncbi:MAG: hypothetical protein ABGX24_02170 [Aquificota bacterium]